MSREQNTPAPFGGGQPHLGGGVAKYRPDSPPKLRICGDSMGISLVSDPKYSFGPFGTESAQNQVFLSLYNW